MTLQKEKYENELQNIGVKYYSHSFEITSDGYILLDKEVAENKDIPLLNLAYYIELLVKIKKTICGFTQYHCIFQLH